MDEGNGNNPCPYCGYKFQIISIEHLRLCETIPDKETLAKILDDDPSLSLTGLAYTYGIHRKYILTRLRGTHWTEEALKKRGRELLKTNAKTAKVGKKKKIKKITTQKKDGYNRCVCGMIIPKGAQKCSWCMLEEAGIKSYWDMYSQEK